MNSGGKHKNNQSVKIDSKSKKIEKKKWLEKKCYMD